MTLEELGRRAVACKHWRWMDGMLIQPLNSRTAVIEEEYIHDRGWSAKRRKWDDLHPDLSDPATLGCLLALVREAWEVRRGSHAAASAFVINGAWGFGFMDAGTFVAIALPSYASEVECLVAALEAAP